MEKVSVITLYNAARNQVLPWKIKYNGRVYTTKEVTLHFTLMHGEILHHRYYVSVGALGFLLDCNTTTLHWTLEKTLDFFTAS